MRKIQAAIIGTKYRGAAAVEALARLKKGAVVALVAEPENQHDANAVAAYANGVHIGYIPRGQNEATVAAMQGGGQTLAATIVVEAIVDRGAVVAAPKIAWEIADAEYESMRDDRS